MIQNEGEEQIPGLELGDSGLSGLHRAVEAWKRRRNLPTGSRKRGSWSGGGGAGGAWEMGGAEGDPCSPPPPTPELSATAVFGGTTPLSLAVETHELASLSCR